MSTATQEEYTPIQGSDLPDAPELILEDRVATGQIAEIGDPKLTRSEDYERCVVKIRGTRGSQDFTTAFMFKPEWFAHGFNAKEHFGSFDKGMGFTYAKHVGISGARDGGFIYTVVGSMGKNPAAGWALWRDALAAKMNEVRRYSLTGEEIVQVLRGLLNQHPVEIGYTLTQQKEKTGVKDEKGREIKRRLDRLEVHSYSELTLDWVKAQVQRAKRDAKFKVAFDPPPEALV